MSHGNYVHTLIDNDGNALASFEASFVGHPRNDSTFRAESVWHLERQENGDVKLSHKDELRDQNAFVTIPAVVWAALVAGVSIKGDTREFIRAALSFHNDLPKDVIEPLDPKHGEWDAVDIAKLVKDKDKR